MAPDFCGRQRLPHFILSEVAIFARNKWIILQQSLDPRKWKTNPITASGSPFVLFVVDLLGVTYFCGFPSWSFVCICGFFEINHDIYVTCYLCVTTWYLISHVSAESQTHTGIYSCSHLFIYLHAVCMYISTDTHTCLTHNCPSVKRCSADLQICKQICFCCWKWECSL